MGLHLPIESFIMGSKGPLWPTLSLETGVCDRLPRPRPCDPAQLQSYRSSAGPQGQNSELSLEKPNPTGDGDEAWSCIGIACAGQCK